MTQTKQKITKIALFLGILVAFGTSSIACSSTKTDADKTTGKEESKTEQTDTTTKDTSNDSGAEDDLTSDWAEYTAKDKSYTVSFPKQPTEKPQTIDTQIGKIDVVEAFYTDNKSYYSTSHTTYPVDPKQYDPQKGLDGSRDGISSTTKMEIVSEKKTEINGFPAREVEMKGKDGAILANLIIDPNGPTLYQVFVVASDGNANTPENQAFLKSFKIQAKK